LQRNEYLSTISANLNCLTTVSLPTYEPMVTYCNNYYILGLKVQVGVLLILKFVTCLVRQFFAGIKKL
ncbi:hypothetical protein JZU68_09020, partial [bacterium]|nr:hypothetical protein [bacterium]